MEALSLHHTIPTFNDCNSFTIKLISHRFTLAKSTLPLQDAENI